MIQIKDNFFSEETFQKLQSLVMSEYMSWNLTKTSGYKTESHKSFAHILGVSCGTKELFDISHLSAKKICDEFKEINNSLLRIRYGLILRENKFIINQPHIDNRYPHYTAIVYLNNSDGETFFFKDKFGKDIIKKVEPKENRIVFFDGEIYHSSSTPTKNQVRYTINYNWRK